VGKLEDNTAIILKRNGYYIYTITFDNTNSTFYPYEAFMWLIRFSGKFCDYSFIRH